MSCIVKGKLKIKCKNCGKIFEDDCRNIDMHNVEANKRGMGKEIHYVGTMDMKCSKCNQGIAIEIECWEYPLGAYNHHDCSIVSGKAEVIECCECEIEMD